KGPTHDVPMAGHNASRHQLGGPGERHGPLQRVCVADHGWSTLLDQVAAETRSNVSDSDRDVAVGVREPQYRSSTARSPTSIVAEWSKTLPGGRISTASISGRISSGTRLSTEAR